MKSKRNGNNNPLSDLISDDVFELLHSYDIITDKLIRDYQIRKKFRTLIALNMNPTEASKALVEDYSSLKACTIKKIGTGKPADKKEEEKFN